MISIITPCFHSVRKVCFSILFFGKSIREKMCFTYRNKKEKNIIFFNVLILPILSLTIEYCKLETPENTD